MNAAATSPSPPTRRTRFVLISDTHNSTPKLPAGDVLIHAGDLTNTGSLSELRRTISWLEKAAFETKIVVAGNHDVTLDEAFYAQHGRYFHNQEVQDSAECRELLEGSQGITYLNHEARVITLGNGITFKVFGSPYSPAHGFWAFGYKPEQAGGLWDAIPLDTDVVVTHTPPKFHCDRSGRPGCEALRQALWRVRPRLAVCGHIHEGRGVENVVWDLGSVNVRFKEGETFYWSDETGDTKKQFRVDLTARGHRPLRNDGSVGALVPHTRLEELRGVEVIGDEEDGDDTAAIGGEGESNANRDEHRSIAAADGSNDAAKLLPAPKRLPERPFPGYRTAQRTDSPGSKKSRSRSPLLATRGQGGPETSGRCDQEALSGRRGRAETCIVNAAIIATSWPHKAGKKLNKPIVVDIDLPLALDKDEWYTNQPSDGSLAMERDSMRSHS